MKPELCWGLDLVSGCEGGHCDIVVVGIWIAFVRLDWVDWKAPRELAWAGDAGDQVMGLEA